MFLLLAVGWASTAMATADGPDHFAVRDDVCPDVLTLRVAPWADAERLGEIACDARGLQNRGCQGLPTIGEWAEMTEAERRESRKNYWCRVGYRGLDGWVAGRFLKEDSASD